MAIFLPFVASVAVVARFPARYLKSVKLAWEDWLALVALVSNQEWKSVATLDHS